MSEDFQPSARIVADSLNQRGERLTTMEVRLHRYMLAEFNTHRMFSRNSASSRAIPVGKTISRLVDEPVYPAAWRAEQKGMQGGTELDADTVQYVRKLWDVSRGFAVATAEMLMQVGVHKSVVNRLLEPFMAHTVVVTATAWDGFWNQRCSPLAQDELRLAAEAMKSAYDASEPRLLKIGRWHLPYVSDDEREEYPAHLIRRVSAARCARVSYLTQDGVRDLDADLTLYDRLVTADPPHASPLEHVATPTLPHVSGGPGNFTGWLQLRHIVGI